MKADETKRKREILLGINPCIYGLNYHDPAVVVLIDGRVVFGVEEERCNRVKHSKGVFPSLALAECLTYCNLTWDDIDDGFAGKTYAFKDRIHHGTDARHVTAVFQKRDQEIHDHNERQEADDRADTADDAVGNDGG